MTSVRRVAVLGSTGSIGTQTLDVISHFPNDFVVTRLATGSNAELLEQQRAQFNVESHNAQCVSDNPDLLAEFAASDDVDIVINGVVGFAGLKATLAAVRSNKVLGLANKESLIAGGPVVKAVTSSSDYTGTIIPVDSEHSAIWQCLRSGARSEVRRLILTASGGPFRGKTQEQLRSVTKEQALKHPTWSMGNKITIDSATLMNKGLEVIEAHELFGIDYDDIEVVVHPQSIVHSMVSFCDGSVIAQLSNPDMRLPISLALGVDRRLDHEYGSMNFDELLTLEFERPDTQAFPSLELAYEAGKKGSGAPATLNAANEVAVDAFLTEKIAFSDIPEIVSDVLQEDIYPVDNEDDVYEADTRARELAKKYVEKRTRT